MRAGSNFRGDMNRREVHQKFLAYTVSYDVIHRYPTDLRSPV